MNKTDQRPVFGRDRALEVAILWGDESLLHVDHLFAPRDYCVGDSAADVDFVLAREAIGTDRKVKESSKVSYYRYLYENAYR